MSKANNFILCMILVLGSCALSQKKDDNLVCKEYFKTFKNSKWEVKSNGIYNFYNNPEYWTVETYNELINEDCFKTLSRDQLVDLLGEPSAEFRSVSKGIYHLEYRFKEFEKLLDREPGIKFYFKNGKLDEIITSPITGNL